MIVVLSDTHIPERALRIPYEIEPFLKEANLIVHAGDLTDKKVLDDLMSFGRVLVVRGNMDYLSLPRYEKFKAGDLKFGVFHGHGIYPRGDRRQLTDFALDLDVDVLITGHTHSPDVYKGEVLILNPGSATGAWGGGGGSGIPSFMVLKVEGNLINVDLYEIREKVSVKRFEFVL
ncbi:MAG: YfcE family phosphodiesterase [Archaeoglobales archaeon]|nr:MAG: YfcE family phosphodiesterase [Archaeoglobales archaeon]